MKKQIICGLALAIILSSSGIPSAWAEGNCAKLLTTTCTSCHSKNKFCPNLGQSKDYWSKTIKEMVVNGAEVAAADQATLADCLSKPGDEAKDVCKK